MEPNLPFQSFPDLASAQHTAALLEQEGIPVELVNEDSMLDSNFIGQNFSNPFRLKIPGRFFNEANEILERETKVNPDDVAEGYMLLSFSNEELLEVLEHKSDWGFYNYKLAEALLQRRGVSIPAADIRRAQARARLEKEKPEEAGTALLVIGYFSAILGSGFALYQGGNNWFRIAVPGLFAIAIGWNLLHFKRTLSDGRRVHYFNSSSRLQGKVLLGLAWGIFLLRVIQAIILS